jgi:hypothetical protein
VDYDLQKIEEQHEKNIGNSSPVVFPWWNDVWFLWQSNFFFQDKNKNKNNLIAGRSGKDVYKLIVSNVLKFKS